MRRFFLILLASWVAASIALGEIIPADRRTTWSAGVGVQGGIPARTTIYQTLSPGATAANINSAIANCPSGQVVFLNAGTYNLSSPISLTKSNVTLRGAGPNATKIIFSTGAYAAINIGGSGSFTPNPITNWISGYSAGSTLLTVASSSGFSSGDLIAVDQNIDSTYVSNADFEGATCLGNDSTCGHLQMEFHKIVSINGNQLTIQPGIYMPNYASGFNPRVMRYTYSPLRNTGIEDLYFEGGAALYNIDLNNAENCWIKNVEGQKSATSIVLVDYTKNCEIRHSRFGPNAGQSTESYGVVVQLSTQLLIEDNIFAGTTDLANGSLLTEHGTAGSVIAYNYFTRISANNCVGAVVANHNPHPCFNLFEGNIAPSFSADFYHGSSSHITAFRNRFFGVDFNTSGTIGQGGGTQTSCFTWAFRLARYNRYFNAVGNILGTSGLQTSVYEARCDNGGNFAPAPHSLGFSHYLNTCDPIVITSLLRHGNWDSVHNSAVWDSTISDHNLPNSLYLAGKPVWFGNLNWPPIDPANPSAAKPSSIPAGYRYINGVDPSSATSITMTLARWGNDIYVTFSAVPGSHYRVEQTTNLKDWTTLADNVVVQGTWQSATVVDSDGAVASSKCYRVLLLP